MKLKSALTICLILVTVLSLGVYAANCSASEITGKAVEPPASQNIFHKFEQKLQDLGIEYSTETFRAELVGAQDGLRYKIGNGRAEVFVFDTLTEDYRKAAETGRIYLKEPRLSMPAVQNGAAFLYINNLNDIKIQLTDIFKNL